MQIRRVFGGLLIAAFVVAGSALGLFLYYNHPPAKEPDLHPFVLAKGETVGQVAARLEREGIVRSGLFVNLLSRLFGTEDRFQSGSYLLPRNKPAAEIHDYLVTGLQVLTRVTIPEGWTISRIARYLQRRGVTSAAAFLDAVRSQEVLDQYSIPAETVEGYLFPDTYLFQADYPAQRIVTHMIDTLYKRLDELGPRPPADELHRRLTLASIIEREYRAVDEAPLMASVFENRLAVNMALQSCATVEYIITETLGRPHPEFLTYQDLRIKSPYNTYLHPGLPPGPISNAGMTAIRAAFDPPKTDYWYFVLRDPASGRHHFSRSLDEHNRAKVIYLKRQTRED